MLVYTVSGKNACLVIFFITRLKSADFNNCFGTQHPEVTSTPEYYKLSKFLVNRCRITLQSEKKVIFSTVFQHLF